MTIKASEITSLIELFSSSGWDELHLEVDGLHLYLSTNPLAHGSPGARAALPSAGSSAPAVQIPTRAPDDGSAMQSVPATADAGAVPATWVAVKAPNLGTFYRSPKPGAPPFVAIGQSLTPQSEICLLEVMKLFTAVQAGVAGVVRRICVNDSEMVEHGQVLMYVEPA
jgi:acetyl-CoA carboxylase biotin carboxyl carrier protein